MSSTPTLVVLTQADTDATGLSDAAKLALDIVDIIKKIDRKSAGLKALSDIVETIVRALGAVFWTRSYVPPEFPVLIMKKYHPGLCFTLESIQSMCRQLFQQRTLTQWTSRKANEAMIFGMLAKLSDVQNEIKAILRAADRQIAIVDRLCPETVDPPPPYTPRLEAGLFMEAQAPSEELLPVYNRSIAMLVEVVLQSYSRPRVLFRVN